MVKKNAITKWPKASHSKWLPRSASGRKSVCTSRCAPCISVAYQRKPNTKRNTNAAMNAKKNFFQFINVSVEVLRVPKCPEAFIAKYVTDVDVNLQETTAF